MERLLAVSTVHGRVHHLVRHHQIGDTDHTDCGISRGGVQMELTPVGAIEGGEAEGDIHVLQRAVIHPHVAGAGSHGTHASLGIKSETEGEGGVFVAVGLDMDVETHAQGFRLTEFRREVAAHEVEEPVARTACLGCHLQKAVGTRAAENPLRVVFHTHVGQEHTPVEHGGDARPPLLHAHAVVEIGIYHRAQAERWVEVGDLSAVGEMRSAETLDLVVGVVTHVAPFVHEQIFRI